MPYSPVNAPLRYPGVLAVGHRIELDSAQASALRFREINTKEAFTLVDAAGDYFRASLTGLGDQGGVALVYEAMTTSPESSVDITLFCAVLARQRMLNVIQKATELGVAEVVPVISERSVQRAGLAHEKDHAWPRQALRASRQCRRASVPHVRRTIELTSALEHESFIAADRRIYMDDHVGTNTVLDEEERGMKRLAFAVGPEGGWSDTERQLLRGHDASILRLGGRILRAETAVLVGLTLLQHVYGDL